MLSKDKEEQLIKLFVIVDDFCIALESWKQPQTRYRRPVTRKPVMSDSEMMTLMLFYQCSGYKCFQYYYEEVVAQTLVEYFPRQVSYERFVALIPRLLPGLYVFLKWRGHPGKPY